MKFRVESPKHSKAIQRELIRLGFKWVYHQDKIVHINEPYLFARVHDMTISFSPFDEAFEKYTDHEETNFWELKLM